VTAFVEALDERLGKRREVVRVSAVFSDLKVWSHWTDAPVCFHRNPLAYVLPSPFASLYTEQCGAPQHLHR
jgi:hypothetical protein